jgi:hypothetical protein
MISTAATARTRHGNFRRQLLTARSARLLLCAVIGIGSTTSVAATSAHAAAPTQTVIAQDGFQRTDSSKWGSADNGGDYRYEGQSSAFTLTDDTGAVSSLRPGRSAEAYLPDTSATDTLLSESLEVPGVDADDLNVHAALEARRQTDGSTYRGRIHLSPGGVASVAVSRTEGSAETGLDSVVLPGRFTAGQQLVLEMQVTGTDPVTISVRSWVAGASRPSWQLTVDDSSGSRITAAGSVGVWDYVSSSAVATTVAHDQFKAASLVYGASTPAPKPTPAPAPVSSTVYTSANFDGWPLGSVDPDRFNTELGSTNRNAAAYDDMSVVGDGRGGHAVRTTLKAGTIHSRPVADGGDNLFISLPDAYDRACMQYDIRFDANFDWSLGGKLPGLMGVAPGVAPATPTGGDRTELGWSGRAMWLTPQSYGWAGPVNMGVSYLYHSGQAGNYGDNIRWNAGFVAGQWHTVKQCYVMNTVGRSDGQLLTWLDGTQVVEDTGVKYRSRGDVHINYIVFSIFRGGGTLDWAGSRTGTIDVNNITVTNR